MEKSSRIPSTNSREQQATLKDILNALWMEKRSIRPHEFCANRYDFSFEAYKKED